MGGEYKHKVTRRIFRNGVQKGRNLDPLHSRLSCPENNQQEREGI